MSPFGKSSLEPKILENQIYKLSGRGRTHDAAEIGLELEVEGLNSQNMRGACKHYWTPHDDGSLRGDSSEFVLRRPINRRELDKALDEFLEMQKVSSFKPELSERCSFHVHLNCCDFNNYEIIKLITLYALYEPFFFDVHGAKRKGNPFALRLIDSATFVKRLCEDIKQGAYRGVGSDNMRYMALNLGSLYKFGSMEFRSHEGTVDPERITAWVYTLLDLYDFSRNNPKLTPADFLNSVSMQGFEDWTEKNFKHLWPYIKGVYEVSQKRDAINIAQDIAYSFDWDNAPKEQAQAPRKKDPLPKGVPPDLSQMTADEVREHLDRAGEMIRDFTDVRPASTQWVQFGTTTGTARPPPRFVTSNPEAMADRWEILSDGGEGTSTPTVGQPLEDVLASHNTNLTLDVSAHLSTGMRPEAETLTQRPNRSIISRENRDNEIAARVSGTAYRRNELTYRSQIYRRVGVNSQGRVAWDRVNEVSREARRAQEAQTTVDREAVRHRRQQLARGHGTHTFSSAELQHITDEYLPPSEGTGRTAEVDIPWAGQNYRMLFVDIGPRPFAGIPGGWDLVEVRVLPNEANPGAVDDF